VQKERRNETVPKPEQDTASPRQCLFCQQNFEDDDEDFTDNVQHMYTAHGLFIPDQTMISNPESFLGYLATEVRVWHECLYCGTTRNSTSAIQSHMRDSNHCMLNLEREPELLEFWECNFDEESNAQDDNVGTSTGARKELSLSPRRVVGSRRDQRSDKARNGSDRRLGMRASVESSPMPGVSEKQNHRQLARRDAMGMQNLGAQQRHALVLAEKRSQKEEAIATRASDWAYARKANKQKHDQAYGPLSWAKGGAHNLLPR
jgi:pre-60S factor REI1